MRLVPKEERPPASGRKRTKSSSAPSALASSKRSKQGSPPSVGAAKGKPTVPKAKAMPTVAKAAKVKAKARPAKKVTFARSSGTLSGSRVHAKAAVKRSRSDSEPLAESAVYRGGPVKASKRAKWANLARARAAIADPHANSVKAAATRRRTVEEALHDERKRMRLRSSSFSQPATPLPANISRKKASGTPSSRPTAPTPTAPRKTLAGPHGEDYQGVARLLKCNVKKCNAP